MLDLVPNLERAAGSSLSPLPERLQRRLFRAVDFEEIDQPGQLQQGAHSLLDMDEFHLAAHLPDHAVTSGQFAQAIAVHEIHAREVDQELLAAVSGEDVNQ